MKLQFIYDSRSEHTIVKMCEALGVSVSGYHAFKNRIEGKEVSQRKQREDRLQERIKQHHYGSLQSYGAPRIHRALLEEGYVVSERKVGGLMRAMGLRSIASSPKQKTTDSNHSNRTYPNELKQHFQTKAPNEAWVTDITYIHTGEGFVYLNPVMDLYSRRIISYQVKDHMKTELCLEALEEAIALRNPPQGFMHHSDQGSQYTSNDYIRVLKGRKAVISMSRKATPYDNACMESFFASMKKEYLYHHVFETKEEAIAAVDFYIRFYNQKRTHSALDYQSPVQREMSYQASQKEEGATEPSATA